MKAELVEGNLLEQDVEVIVNAWNRNVIPWWLLLPQGISGAIKKRAGLQPFKELAKLGPMKLGEAVETSAGNLPYKAIIHVAGIGLDWRSSEEAIRLSVRNALNLAGTRGYASIAFPAVGAGTGGIGEDKSLTFMTDEVERSSYLGHVVLVRFKRSSPH